MTKIVNLTNSPFDLQSKDGKVLLPAFGDVDAEFDEEYLAVLRASRSVDVEDAKKRGRPKKDGAS